MKIVLQGFEPQSAPATMAPVPSVARAAAATTTATDPRRTPRLRFTPVATDTRLFHAL